MALPKTFLLTAEIITCLALRAPVFAQQPLTVPDGSETRERSAPAVSTEAPADASIAIASDLLSSLISQTTVENDDVATRVLEADVRGIQTTTTSVTVETEKDVRQARFNLIAKGSVNSNTIGVTRQARIATQGSHIFSVRKPVFFDGRLFRTKAAYGRLQARQVPQNVQSITTGIPLIGDVGNQIAWQEVLRRMPESDAVVVRRVADDVMPKFNRRTDRRLAALNLTWAEFRGQVDRIVGSRVAWTARSDENYVQLETRGTESSAVPAPFPNQLQDSESCVIVVSGAAVNQVLNDLPLDGLTVTDTALRTLLENSRNNTRGMAGLVPILQNLDAETQPILFSIELARQQPLKIRFSRGALSIELTFRILPIAGPAGQWIKVSTPVRGISVEEDKWSLKLDETVCSPVAPDAEPDQWTTMIRSQVSQISKVVQPPVWPRTLNLNQLLKRTDDEATLPEIQLHRILMSENWLRVSFRTVPSELTAEDRATDN